MQIWPLLHAAKARAETIHRQTLIYDSPTTFLNHQTHAAETIDEQFHLPPNERTYWAIRHALTDIAATAALYHSDGHHGQPFKANPTVPLALHAAGRHATHKDDPDHPYAHWETLRDDLAALRATLATETAKPPEHRNPPIITAALTQTAANAALFEARARLTLHDRDPHATDNFAVIQWQRDDWTVIHNYCHYGFVPAIPDSPGQYPDETLCYPCIAFPPPPTIAARIAAPDPYPLPPTILATPYYERTTPTTDRGIITGATAKHWPHLAAIALAANQHNIPLAIADHGLTETQRQNLNQFAVRWIHAPHPPIPPAAATAPAIADPKAWAKPWICLASPFDRTLWIDADAIPLLNNLQPLDPNNTAFQIATDNPWNPRSAAMYTRLNHALPNLAAPETPDPTAPACNTGIIAWTRHDPLITRWANTAEILLSHPELTPLCRVRDQSAMWIAIRDHQTETRQHPSYLDPTWNWPADGLPATEAKNRLPIPYEPHALLETTRKRHPWANIVHWLGRPKPQNLYAPE